MTSNVEQFATLPDLIDRATALVLTCLEDAIAARGQFTLVLAGGSTPKPLYERLAQQALPWEKIHVFWGDERYVPATHPDSNQLMARQAWLDHVPIPAANIHPMSTTANDPVKDAAAYADHLQAFFGTAPGAFPAFDLILLGMGDDGHTASLFPGTAVLQMCDRLIDVGYRGSDPRITFTIPLINQAHNVAFLVAGASKYPALQAILAENGEATQYPSRFIAPLHGQLFWLLDRSAATGSVTSD